MSKKATKDDVLSIFDESEEPEFSGFSSDRGSDENTKTPRVASKVVKITNNDKSRVAPKAPKVTGSKKAGKNKPDKADRPGKTKDSSKNIIDLDNLSPENVARLRNVLGLQTVSRDTRQVLVEYDSDESVYPFSVHDPNPDDPLHLNDDMVGDNDELLTEKIGDTLFMESEKGSMADGADENDDFWALPKLKAPDRGEKVSQSLVDLINTACTKTCQTNEVVEKYKVPSNCENMCAPRVNEEVWGELIKLKRVQSTDKLFRDIQGLITAGMVPLLTLAKVLKPHISNVPEAKTLLSDALTMLGQVQFNISIRRRYLLRPYLKTRYANICNINTPISGLLFGDDISKEIKKCETGVKVGKSSFPFGYNVPRGRGYTPRFSAGRTVGYGPVRARGRGMYRARPYGYGGYGYQTAQPSGSGYGQYGHQYPRRSRKPGTADPN